VRSPRESITGCLTEPAQSSQTLIITGMNATRGMQAVHRRLSHEDLYRIIGLQKMPFNTVYQLASEGDALK
jgi:hypothetical protein